MNKILRKSATLSNRRREPTYAPYPAFYVRLDGAYGTYVRKRGLTLTRTGAGGARGKASKRRLIREAVGIARGL